MAFGAPRRRVFVSYHHGGDQDAYDQFSRRLDDIYDVIHDSSLDRRIDSNNPEYVIRRIREDYIRGSSCTLVLCGLQTPYRKFVDWEIDATLQQHGGLIGIRLPSLPIVNDGSEKPPRLQDNIDSGYALWTWLDGIFNDPQSLSDLIEQANARSVGLIRNSRPRRLRNG